jgi:hypothetical protein
MVDDCALLDSGRLINKYEAFWLKVHPHEDLILITRVHPAYTGDLDIFVESGFRYDAGGQVTPRAAYQRPLDQNILPFQPGQWLDIATYIPGDWLQTEDLAVTIIPYTPGGFYAPYFHKAFQGEYTFNTASDMTVTQPASYENGAFTLSGVNFTDAVDTDRITLGLQWYTDGRAKGDYRLFVHLYDDINQPPIAQTDTYPGNGTLPPGNWLPGFLHDTIEVDISKVPDGVYQLAIGFYNPYTNERLMPESAVYMVMPDGRLFLGEVEIKRNGG